MQVSPETSAQYSLQHVVINLDMYNSSLELESVGKPRIFEISCSSLVYMNNVLACVPHSNFDRFAGMFVILEGKWTFIVGLHNHSRLKASAIGK